MTETEPTQPGPEPEPEPNFGDEGAGPDEEDAPKGSI